MRARRRATELQRGDTVLTSSQARLVVLSVAPTTQPAIFGRPDLHRVWLRLLHPNGDTHLVRVTDKTMFWVEPAAQGSLL